MILQKSKWCFSVFLMVHINPSIDASVKRNFWPVVVCQLWCFSE